MFKLLYRIHIIFNYLKILSKFKNYFKENLNTILDYKKSF